MQIHDNYTEIGTQKPGLQLMIDIFLEQMLNWLLFSLLIFLFVYMVQLTFLHSNIFDSELK